MNNKESENIKKEILQRKPEIEKELNKSTIECIDKILLEQDINYEDVKDFLEEDNEDIY